MWNANFWPIFITVSPHPRQRNDRGRIWEYLSSTDLGPLFPNLTLCAGEVPANSPQCTLPDSNYFMQREWRSSVSGVSENKPPARLTVLLFGRGGGCSCSIPIGPSCFPWALKGQRGGRGDSRGRSSGTAGTATLPISLEFTAVK